MNKGEKIMEEAPSSNPWATLQAQFANLSLSSTRPLLPVAGPSRSASPPGFNPMMSNDYNAIGNSFDYDDVVSQDGVAAGWRQPLRVFPQFVMRVVEMAMTASGAAFLRRVLDLGGKEDVEGVLREVVESPWLLMKNRHGSSVFQRLVDVGSSEMTTVLLRRLVGDQPELFRVCYTEYGKDSMLSLLRRCDTREQHWLLGDAFIIKDFLRLVSDSHGTHVASLLLKELPYQFVKLAITLIGAHLREVARDRSGCCVIQKCVAEYSHHKERSWLINLIINHALELAQDDYGNYVVQNILEIPEVADIITEKFQGSFASLATQKCSSNVVEKCILNCGYSNFRDIIVIELFCDPRALDIFQDPYGNYVVQRALSKAKDRDFESMAAFILSHRTNLSCNLYARNILKNIGKRKERRHHRPH